MTHMHGSSQDPPVGSSSSPAPLQVPSPVAALAAERQLGELHNARIVVDPASIARAAAIIGVPSAVFVALGRSSSGILGVLALLGLLGLLVAIVTAAYAVKTKLAGGDDWYLYGNGIVDGRGRRLRAITWPEVATVTRKRMGRRARRRGTLMTPDTLRGYQLGLRDGSKVFLTASDFLDEGKRLGAQLEQLTAQANIPISG
jgi:hypothetical protein